MEDFGGNYARELRKDGYPIFLFLNPETLEVYVPDSDHLKGKALLNWLAKVGTFEEFKSVWDSTYTSGLYSDGEQNPLHLVALYRRNDFLSRIPELADLANLKDENENTVAHYAAGIGNQEILEQLTDPKRSVNFANKDGDYPIHVAIENGHTDLVKWFVLELNLKNKMSSRNTSPMAAALNARRFEIVEFLEPLKPERLRIEKTSMDGLFLSLCYFGWPSMVEYMLRYYSGSLRISDEFDPVEPAIKSTNPEVLKLVLDRTKSLKSKDAKQSYLHMAAYEDVPQMVEPLLANGLDVNGVISNNVTALYVAVTNGNLDVTLELLKNGADPNIHPDGGVSPIWAATYLGNRDEIQALIEAGASCELKPDFANTMVEYATLYDVPEVVLIALEECLSPDYELYDEFPGVFVADYFESNGVRSVLEERGQLLESV
ncbi:MAG: ankyrin repeat domain-containing protein, partial [Verrucomicrobiae bacterium]|nr:ankyrin repeat domain-containing protein [Verrucomicrobiae bacterium]